MKKLLISATLCCLLAGCAVVEKKETQLKIKSTVYKNNDKLSYCYKKALEENQNLEGEMALEWDVLYLDGQERVANVAVKSTNVNSETLAACMKKAVSLMYFDLPTRYDQKVHRVSYPFVFKNDDIGKLKRR